jgi:hypothetical protein
MRHAGRRSTVRATACLHNRCIADRAAMSTARRPTSALAPSTCRRCCAGCRHAHRCTTPSLRDAQGRCARTPTTRSAGQPSAAPGLLSGWLPTPAASPLALSCRPHRVTIRAGYTRQRERTGPTRRQKEESKGACGAPRLCIAEFTQALRCRLSGNSHAEETCHSCPQAALCGSLRLMRRWSSACTLRSTVELRFQLIASQARCMPRDAQSHHSATPQSCPP